MIEIVSSLILKEVNRLDIVCSHVVENSIPLVI